MNLFELFAMITLDTSGYKKGVEESQSLTGKLQKGISNVKKVAAGVTAAVATVSTVLAKVGIEAAAEVRAETSAFQQTFGDMQEVASAAIGRVADDAGILQTRLNTLGSKIYAFARSSGGEVEESTSLMERALRVAADSAAYYDKSVEDATETLQSFLKGNFENDAALGLSATETTRNAAAMELFGEKYNNLTEIQKQQTLFKMVEDAQRLSGAMGQAAREADGWENVIGNLKEAWRQLQARMGEPILDAVTPILQKGTDLLIQAEKNFDGINIDLEKIKRSIILAAEAFTSFATGFAAQRMIQNFQEAQVAVSLLSLEVGKANLAQAALNGKMTIGETVVALLTGKMKLATLAQAAMAKAQSGLNAVMAANPIGLVITAVGLLGVAIHKSISDINELAESFEIQAETSEEAAKHLDELKSRLDEYERNPNKRTKQEREEYAALEKAIAATEEQIIELQKTEQEAAAAAAQAAADPVNIFSEATKQYEQDATALYSKFVETYEGIFDKVKGWFKPFQEAATSVKTNIDEMMSAMASQIEFNNAYAENIEKLKDYGLGSLSDAFQTYGADGAAYAQAIVSAVEEAGGATTEEGQKIIQNFEALNQKVTESQGTLSESMTLFDGEFAKNLQSMTDSYGEAISGLDKGAEAKNAALSTFQSFIDGMNSQIPIILDSVSALSIQIADSLENGRQTISDYAAMYEQGTGQYVDGSYASGLSYVPFDGYIAELHQGERVLTAREASQYRGNTQSRQPINITVQSVLDGRVIGESAYHYIDRKERAMGG